MLTPVLTLALKSDLNTNSNPQPNPILPTDFATIALTVAIK